MAYVINPNGKDVWLRDNADTMDISPATDASSVYTTEGKSVEEVFNKYTGDIETTGQTIQSQEQQITNLEKMLIQGIVNMNYNNALLNLDLKL